MKKFLFVLVALCILVGGGWYGYQKFCSKHYLIAGAEESLRDMMKSPSSFVLKEVSFYVEQRKIPTMYMEYEAKNSFNASLVGQCVICFHRPTFYENIDPNSKSYNASKEAEDRIRNNVNDGSYNIAPFEDLKISSIYVNGEQLDELNLTLFELNIMKAHRNYRGPSLGGRVEKINDDGTIQCSFDRVTYTPGKLFPYSR